MILEDWLKKEKINPCKFAKSIGAEPSVIYRNLSGAHKLSAKYAVKVEKATGGEVSRIEAIWPEDFIDKKGKMEQMSFLNKIGDKKIED